MALEFAFENTLFSDEQIEQEAARTRPALKLLRDVLARRDWTNWAAPIMLPSETKFAQACTDAAKKCKGATLFAVIGIGGSNLGSMACVDFMLGSAHNLTNTKKRIIFPDTCDPDSLNESIILIKQHLKGKGKIILNIISKSGSTTETLANFEVIYSSLSASEKRRVYVVATTDAGSKLHELSSKKGWMSLPIPAGVGGRYSVLSPVGLFPLAYAGVDITQMLQGAKESVALCLDENPNANPALKQAALLSLFYKQEYRMFNTFVFSNDMFSYCRWWKQLLAESCGKDGKGMTPLVAVGSTDLHSQAQLYLGGPHDKAFRFISIKKHRHDQILPKSPELSALSSNLAGKSTSHILWVLHESITTADRRLGLPYWQIILPDKSAKTLGSLLELDMITVVLFCQLLGVNAFDQPTVEEYKKEAHKLLA